METTLSESSLTAAPGPPETNHNRRFADLRGVLWRMDLGILPSSPSSVDDLRRVTADSRRRYAAMRRHLLVDPHVPKDGNNVSDPVMDNPLSQNPDSMWGRFFRNAELERMVDQDLSRLYPEHGSYFQTPGCQAMLRRILLLWCLRHPKYGYQQGMHELLAPLLYVLHVDVEHLSEVREHYEEHFNDKFDGFSFHESNLMCKFDFKKYSDFIEDGIGSKRSPVKGNSLHELDPSIQDVILLSDAYGAEGELGIIVSEKFMEHDAYCMFDALMNGAGGTVALADFFNSSPLCTSHAGVPPVIEASSALYHLLSIVDSSLHSHLVEIGVEPQYFALRWLRVLFGREFALQDLLIIWDEIFASDSTKLNKSMNNDAEPSSAVLISSRGAFISAFSVSMILHLRSSLLATENATSCLKRLLNFPEDINLRKLIAKAKSLQTLAMDANNSMSLPINDGPYDQSKSTVTKHHLVSSDSVSPKTPLSFLPESYWEEKWRVLHKEQENKEDIPKKQLQNCIKGWSQKVKWHLSRTESAPSPSRDSRKMEVKASVRRSLLEDLARQLGSDEDIVVLVSNKEQKDPLKEDVQNIIHKNLSCTTEDRCLSGNVSSEENSSIYSDAASTKDEANDLENQSESGISNISIEGNTETNNSESIRADSEDLRIPLSNSPEFFHSGQDDKDTEKSLIDLKEQKVGSGKFQWFWKIGRRAGEETSEKGHSVVATNASTGGYSQGEVAYPSAADACNPSSTISEEVDQNVFTLRSLGQSMLENIQVIESAFQQDRDQVRSMENFSKNVFVGKDQVTAMTALKELRKISNLLSEM